MRGAENGSAAPVSISRLQLASSEEETVALGRKGSRRIVVDGTPYRWRLRGRPTYGRGMGWLPSSYAVEQTGGPGSVLVVTTNQPHASNWVGLPAGPVLPRDVADAVRDALARGWTPGHPGVPFFLDKSADFVPWDGPAG